MADNASTPMARTVLTIERRLHDLEVARYTVAERAAVRPTNVFDVHGSTMTISSPKLRQ